MLRIFGVLVVSALVVAIAWWIASLPGQVIFAVAGTTIEASAPVMVLCLLVLVTLVYVAVRLLVRLLTLGSSGRRWRAMRERRSGDVAVNRALVALAAGDPGDARRQAGRAMRLLGDTPQTLLLAASAGRLAGREDEAAQYFGKLTKDEDTAFLGYRGLLRQALDREDFEQARVLARQADAAHPGSTWVREERAKLAIRDRDWQAALLLSEPDGPVAALGVAAADAAPDRKEALRLAKRAWKADPGLTPAALAYAARLRAFGNERRARLVLRETWKLAPQPDLASLFLAPTALPSERQKLATILVAANPDHLESHILLAECALAAGSLPEARRHAEAAQRATNQRRVWMLLTDIAQREHGDGEAVSNALRHAATADPDPEWRCTECATAQPNWHAVCPACGATGKMRWISGPPGWQPKILPLAGPWLTPGLS